MTIRQSPDDFKVHERLNPAWTDALRPDWQPHSTFAAYELTKSSLTTPDALGLLAKRIGVPVGKWSYAGLKDKHAHTTQTVTVPIIDAAAAAKLSKHEIDVRWSAQRVGFCAEPIAASAIRCNEFALIVRDLSKQAAAEMDRRANVLSLQPEQTQAKQTQSQPNAEPPHTTARTPQSTSHTPQQLLIVNYFGSQRFGSARHKRGFAAAYLARGDFEQALGLLIASPSRKDSPRTKAFGRMLSERWGDWQPLATELPRCPERRAIETLASGAGFREAFASLPAFIQQMCVEAFQSHLWNLTVRSMIESLESLESLESPEVSEAASDEPTSASVSTSHSAHTAPTQVVALRSGRSGRALLNADDLFGKLVFAGPATLPDAWRNLTVPMPAKGVEPAEPWASHAAAALESEAPGLSMNDLRVPDLRRPFFGKADRPLTVLASNFAMTQPERDPAAAGKRVLRTVRFELPRGAYATVVLRALGQ